MRGLTDTSFILDMSRGDWAAFEYQCSEGMMTARRAMTMAEFYAAMVA